MRLLFIAHGHPTFSPGGAERAAYSLFRHVRNSPEVKSAIFAARVPDELVGHDANFGLFRGRADEILMSVPEIDHFTHQTTEYNQLRRRLLQLFEYAKPDVVHLHHFVTFGLEIIEIAKSYGAQVILTIHEYLTICHNFGQMVKTSGRLCHASSPLECSRCFPEQTPGKFFLREQIIKALMSHCDFLIAPSEFLRDRFVSWGVSGEAITVIENSLDPDALLDKQEGGANHRRVVGSAEIMGKYSLGYFGQINPFKGLHVLLDAIQLLPNDVREAIHVGIHGANLEIQAPDFQERIEQALKIAGDCVFNYGPYENDNVVDLMRGYDRIVVPSIWWENSPVVIQEARLAGTPLLCSHLGGMAEKAKSSLDIHFQVGSPVSLATEIVKLVGAPERPRTAFADLISEQKLALSAHLALYRAVLTQA